MEILFHLQWSIMMEISGDLCEWEKIQGNLLGDNTLPPSLPLFSPQPQSDEAVRLCLREKGHDVLVLQRLSSEQLSASARGGGREEARNRR